jgi:L-ascorbate metabolism protein UlaG (beta-lactamase superfamily)
MKGWIFLLCAMLASCTPLEKYRDRVVMDPPASGRGANLATVTPSGVRITYLGTNGYIFESGGTTIVVDPYFTRSGLLSIGLGLRFPNPSPAVQENLPRLPRRADAILVTHGHFDHLLDVPPVARQIGGKVIASPTSIYLARAAGIPASQCRPVRAGQILRAGGATIWVLAATHDCVVPGHVPYDGLLHEVPPPPQRPGDWVCGEPLAFLIELGGQRIYVDSGGTPALLPPANLGRVDLAILGVALRDSRQRLAPALEQLRPRYFLPSHQDHFFRPLSGGFVFGPLTDFPAVLRTAGQQPAPLILLGYYRPWTLR